MEFSSRIKEKMAMSLDEIIEKSNELNNTRANKPELGKGFRRGGGARFGQKGGIGPIRRRPFRRISLPRSPYYDYDSLSSLWEEAYESQASDFRRVLSSEPTTIVVSNLNFSVSDDDIVELFSEIGQLKNAGIVYDKVGRSAGYAMVVFLRRADALAARDHYDGKFLDGRPMFIHVDLSPPPLEVTSDLAGRLSRVSNRRGEVDGRGGSRRGRRGPRRGRLGSW